MKFSIANNFSFVAALLLAAAGSNHVSAAKMMKCDTSYGVIANRGSGDVTFISEDGSDVFTLPLPVSDTMSTERAADTSTPSTAEPMYVSYTRDYIFVGDRANNAMVALNPMALEENPKIITGISDGIFHQWSNDDTIVVSCDIANHVTIISLDTMMVDATIDLMDQGDYSIVDGQKPHDIIITPSGDAIFVSIVGTGDGFNDAILKIDTSTKRVVKRLDLPASADPHLGLSAANPELLYSPQQNLGVVAVYQQSDLTEVQDALEIPNAHGIGSTMEGEYLYVTNIANGGMGALNTIYLKTATEEEDGSAMIKGSAVDAPNAVPHNVAVTEDGYVFVTHSGAEAMSVSVFSTNDDDGLPTFKASYTAGTNPFGLATARYECEEETEMTSGSIRSSVAASAVFSLAYGLCAAFMFA